MLIFFGNIYDIKRTTELKLINMDIKEIPQDISKLVNLEILFIENCNIREIKWSDNLVKLR